MLQRGRKIYGTVGDGGVELEPAECVFMNALFCGYGLVDRHAPLPFYYDGTTKGRTPADCTAVVMSRDIDSTRRARKLLQTKWHVQNVQMHVNEYIECWLIGPI